MAVPTGAAVAGAALTAAVPGAIKPDELTNAEPEDPVLQQDRLKMQAAVFKACKCASRAQQLSVLPIRHPALGM